MKILSALLILSGISVFASAQTSFTIENIHGPDDEYISDIQYANSRYYALSLNTETIAPYRNASTLLVFNDSGELINQAQVGEFGYKYFRILSIFHNKLKLVGSIKTDSCSSTLAVSEYDFSSGTLTHLAQYNLCDGKYVHSMRIVPGLDNKTFLEAIYSPDEADQTEFNHKTLFFQLDSNTISLIPGLEEYESHLSVDFSGKGYVVRWGFVCEYYDHNFNHRYQYNNNTSGYAQELNSCIQPLVNHYLLEHTLFADEDHNPSEQIRLIDSNLYTKKSALINPLSGYGDYVRLPLYGGVSVGSYNSIWTTSNFGYVDNETPAYFSITRLDSDLKVVCTHFIGFDGRYKINGITAFEDNGAIVYGWKKYYDVLHGIGDKNIFALKIGNDCELSTTATHGPSESITSISAYPNPGLNDLTFDVKGFDPSTLRVDLVDGSGKILFTKKDLTNSIEVPQLPAGQYFYRILKEEKLLGTGSWVKE
ncbi:MAG: T9SS type A sorting domain-containing protein [Saprospiraceae bacterium]|uniref:T9SS type A sorting domain-containing protein n=1 Tax=Candidatus Opimibacter skivensis TaxID=2982028 RepID=A0A9D7T1Z0_9BACT|nr:T9SS type A sorting domain-containing protein [Candidatus Opimibacter skivensis]